MAITIIDRPYPFSKKGQKLMFVIESDNVGNDGFKYVFKVESSLSGQSNIVIVPPNPNNMGMLDLSAFTASFVPLAGKDGVMCFTDQTTVSVHSFFNRAQYQVFATEGWIVDGAFYYDESSFVDVSLYESYTPVIIGVKCVYAFYTILDGYKPDPNLVYSFTSTTSLLMGSRKPNTNYPSALSGATPSGQRVFIPVRKSELDWGCLNFVVQGLASLDYAQPLETTSNPYLRMTLYESDGTPNTASFNDSYWGGANAYVESIGVYPANLNAHGELLRPADFPNWRYYDIAMYDSTNTTRKSALYTFYPVDDDCTFDNVRLAWWDDVVGGFDFFNFQRKNEITMEVERKRIKPVVGTYDAATFSFNTFDAEIKEGMIDAVDYLEVTSGWIQEGEFELLKHLVKSKLVYIVNDDATLTPVVMETNSFLVNKERNAKLKSVSFRLRIAQQNIQ